MCYLIVCFLFFAPSTYSNPVSFQMGSLSQADQFQNDKNMVNILKQGATDIKNDQGFHNLINNQLYNNMQNKRYGETSNNQNNHLDALRFNKQSSMNNNGNEGTSLEKKIAHKKGHHKNGFHNSYHKDEVGSNSSFYDDGMDEGGQQVFKNNQGKYQNVMADSNRGDHSDHSYYANDRNNQNQFSNGQNYADNINDMKSHNRNNYYDGRNDADHINRESSYRNYNGQQEYSHKPQMDFYNSDYNRRIPKKHITIYEDPRYVSRPMYSNPPNDEYIELDVRPPRDFIRRPSYDYY